MTLSLSFKSYDSKSTLSFVWRDGRVTKKYNGRPSFSFQMTAPPQSVEAFEQLCRERFLLGQKWQCQAVVGVAS